MLAKLFHRYMTAVFTVTVLHETTSHHNFMVTGPAIDTVNVTVIVYRLVVGGGPMQQATSSCFPSCKRQTLWLAHSQVGCPFPMHCRRLTLSAAFPAVTSLQLMASKRYCCRVYCRLHRGESPSLQACMHAQVASRQALL